METITNEIVEASDRSIIASKEIEIKIKAALSFPRNLTLVEEDIKAMCSRPRFADGSTYSLPRGDKMVSGPSVHFAKGIAQLYGNLEHGHLFESRTDEETRGAAYAWDYQRNIKIKKEFHVVHKRKAKGRIKVVTDPTEITEMVNAQIARAVRNSILEIIPWYIVEEALEACALTMKLENEKKPIEKRREQAKELFKKYGVDDEKIKLKFNRVFDELTNEDLEELRKVYNAIKDGFYTVARWFGEDPDAKEESNLEKKMREAEENQAAEPEPSTPTEGTPGQVENPEPEKKEEPKEEKPKTKLAQEYKNLTKGCKR